MSEERYTTQHAASLYEVAIETVRSWSQEFDRHLSPTANPGRRRQRMFTHEDMGVFALISKMKGEGATYADIHLALDAGERGSSPGTPPDELQVAIASDDRRALVAANDELRRRIETLHLEIEKLRDVEKENIRLQTQLESTTGRAERAEQLSKGLQDEQATLHEQIGELRGELKAVMRQLGQGEK